MVHVDSQSDKEKFIPENPEKYVASGLSVMKISNDESNLFYGTLKKHIKVLDPRREKQSYVKLTHYRKWECIKILIYATDECYTMHYIL